jgi:hypothetical protein
VIQGLGAARNSSSLLCLACVPLETLLERRRLRRSLPSEPTDLHKEKEVGTDFKKKCSSKVQGLKKKPKSRQKKKFSIGFFDIEL